MEHYSWNINENFIAYVKDNNIDVYNYFLGDDNAVEELFDPLTNEKYDLKHLAATMNAYFEKMILNPFILLIMVQ